MNKFNNIKAKIEELILFNEKGCSIYHQGCSDYIDSFNKTKTLRDNINLFD